MEQIEALIERFPVHSWTIRQLHRCDAEFRELCADYGDALRALEHWCGVGGVADERATEYRQLATELEEEILTYARQVGGRITAGPS